MKAWHTPLFVSVLAVPTATLVHDIAGFPGDALSVIDVVALQ